MNKWIKSFILLLFALTTQWVQAQNVAKVGNIEYATIEEAIAAANGGETIEVIAAGNYNLPSLPKNVTIEGKADGEVSFTHTTAGNIAGVPNGATFKNVTFYLGNQNYHGFQHAGTINMEDCTLDGKLFSYGDMNFTDCSFNQSNSDYHMWAYSGNLTYTDCTFTNSATGKFINVYNESGATKYTVTANNCTFINNGSSNKAALNVKATSGSTLLAYDVIINNCSTEGSFPEASSSAALVVLNSIAQVDDRTASGVDNITVTKDGVLIYPATVAAIGETRYPTLQAAVDAAKQMGGEVTINIIDDISGETVTIPEVANFKLTIDGKKDDSSNYTVDAVIVVDGLRGNGGSTTNGASVTLQNIDFVNGDYITAQNTAVIQPSHYPHHLTIQDCSYTGKDTDASRGNWFMDVVDGPLYGATVKNVTVEHSRLIQGNFGLDVVFENIIATNDAYCGFNIKTEGTVLIKDCQVTTAKYALRDQKDAYVGTITLENNTFVSTTAESDEGVIVNRGGAVGTAHINVVSGTYTGPVKVLNGKEGVLAISGGYFSEEFPQNYIAANLVAQGKVCAPATDKEGYFTIGDPHYVAKIGETGYPTLQAAVNAAQQIGGEVTVNIIDDISGETVTIQEVANFKLTIDGQKDASSNYTVDAVIVVDGLRGNGGSTTNGASVTLQNIAFVKTTATDGIQASHYPHHLTIQDCTYSGFDNDKWFLNASVDGPLYGVTVKNVTVEKARLIYANMAEDAVFQNITATNDIKVGFNVKTSGTALIENCEITTGKYAFRDYSDAYEGTFTLEGNTFISTSEENDEGVIVNRGGAVGTAHVNVVSGTYTGHVKVLNGKEGVLAISDGYFSEEFPQEYIAADLVAQGKVCVPATDKEGYFTIGDPHYVAQIGETKYVSLAAAVSAAQANDVITMIDDDNLSLTAAGSEVTIDKPLTITGAVDESGKPKFTIFGSTNGALNNNSFNDLFLSCSTGTVTISNLKFDGFGNEISSVMGHSPVFIGSRNQNAVIENVYISNLNCEGIHINGGTFSIKDCNIDCSKTTNSIFTKGICVVNDAEGSIENTTITGVDCDDPNDTSAAIELQGSGNVDIIGCTIESETIGVATTPVGELTAGTSQVTISDCTITSHNIAVYSNGDKGALTSITSGRYSGLLMAGDNDEGFSISGGVFDDEPAEAYCAEGYAPAENTDPTTKEAYPYTVLELPDVAQIDDVKYKTLQAALDAAYEMTGNVTIELLDNISGYSIVHQKAGVNITIDGKDKTVAGQIIVDGDGRASGTETLTIQNVNFEGNTSDFLSGTDAFVLIPSTKDTGKPYTTGKYNYAHNITVKDCSFTSTSSNDPEYDVVGIKATSGAGCYNVVVDNATGANLHSLAQLTGTTGGAVTNSTVTAGESFVNVNGGAGEFTISGNMFTSAEGADGYGVRENGTSSAVINLTGNTFTAANSIVLGKGSNATAGTINVESGVYTGAITKTDAATGKIAISGGYFSEEFPQEYIAADLVAQGNDCVPATDMEGYFTVGIPTYVAQIGEVKYRTLADAVAAVPTDGTETTILMIDNETINSDAGVTIPADKNVVLDLNGKTVKGVVQNPVSAQTILNKGTLVITDSSDEKNGTITNEVSDENAGSPGNGKNWFSNAVTNNGTLTVNAGNIVNTATGGACYAIDNITNGTLCTPVLNIAGGNIRAKKVAVRMFCNSTTNDNTVNVTGGVITSENAYALQTQMANSKANKAVLNISGGTLSGQYSWVDYGDKNVATQFDNASYSITGGFFSGSLWSYATYYCGMDGFVSGGYFDNVVSGDLVAPGSACVDNTEEETMEAYPYTIGIADVHYYWLDNNGQIDGGGYYTIYAPFAGPDPVLMDGEFVELQKDITLTKDIEYLEECSFGDPIFKGGTFTLTFGEYSIDLNGHVFPIPTGVTILTDKQTDIFSALDDGYKVVEETTENGYAYSVVPKTYVAQIGDVKYETLADAVAAVPTDGTETTILMIDDETVKGNSGIIIATTQNVILDLNGKTVTLSVTESKGSQLLTNRGTLTITDGSNEQTGKLTNIADESLTVGSWPTNNYVTNVITNSGTLNMEGGTVVNTANGSICYAIDNNSTSYDAILNIKGGLLTAQGTVVRQFCNSTTKQNVINMTGGVVTTEGSAAIWTQLPGSNSSSKKLATLNISGGEIAGGTYAWYDYSYGDSFEAVEYNITGGKLKGYLYSYAVNQGVISGFVSGGLFSEAVSGSYVAPGYACIDNTDEETMEAYPYTIGIADVHYYWLDNNGQIDGGGYYTIYAPFAGPDPVLMDGEFVELQKDITLTKDIEYLEECSFGDPIFKGGTFTLTFGEYSIDLNGHVFPIPTGVTILTDKQTDIFSALDDGYKVVEETTETGYAYSVVPKTYVAQIGDVKYETLQAALDAAHEMTGNVTIELLDNISGYSIVHQKAGVNITIDGKDKTVAGQIIIDGDGRASGTETLTIQNVKFEGNTSDFLSGTDAFVLIPSTKDANKPYTTGKYNYAHNITVKDCSFTSTSSSLNVVGVKANSNAGCYNMVLSNDTGTNLHSLAQLTGTTGGTIENNTVTQSESFLNINGGTGEFTVSGNMFTSAEGADGYGVRENAGSSANITLTGNTFTAANTIVLGKGSSNTNGTINVVDGVYTGGIKMDISEAATGKIAISGGYFSEEFPQEYIAETLVDQGYTCIPATDKPGYFTVGTVPTSTLIVFHDSGNYEEAFEVPIYSRMASADIYYKVNGGAAQKYSAPVSISEDTELEAWLQVGSKKVGESVTRSYAIVEKPAGPSVTDNYYYIKNNGNGKYVNVAGRKTVNFKTKADAEKAAGAVIRVKAAEGGAVETLRSQAIDLPGYAKRAMNYVPEMVQLVVSKLHADGAGSILGENGMDAIMAKFNESFDYNLYLEEGNSGYRIYGRTPSMKPVVDFYAENKYQVDTKLPDLESFINSAIDKLKAKLNGRGNSILKPFSVEAVWEAMGGTLTKPEDAESTARFYEEVLASESNVWSFAYETAMMYYEPLMASETFQSAIGQFGDYSKYLEKLPNVRPNFKYYIVADGSKVDFISEGNPDSNTDKAEWTLEDRSDFTVAFEADNMLVDGKGTKYYTTLYTDFAYTMPENAKAYAVTSYNTKDVADLEELTGVIPAQTPVLLMTQDESLEATLTLSTEAGTAPATNLLKGADWIVNEYDLQTAQLHDLFELVKEKLGENFYNNYLAKYEHLLALNAGTVNNKYFFGLKAEYVEEVTNIRQLGVDENELGEMKLGFYENYNALPANKAFLIEEPNPVLIPLWPDVNCDGYINVADITALTEIVLDDDVYAPNWIYPYYNHTVADVNQDGIINVTDITELVGIVLGLEE